MANWHELDSGIWYNLAKATGLCVGNDPQNPTDPNFYWWYTWDGSNWLVYHGQQFATAAAAQTALNTFAGGLG